MRDVLTLDTNWTAGEIPPSLLIDLLDPPQDLTAYTLQVRMTRDGTEFTPAAGTPVEFDDPLKSRVKVNFADGDVIVTEGNEFSLYEIEVWAAGGGIRIATKTVIVEVYPQVGSAPTITP